MLRNICLAALLAGAGWAPALAQECEVKIDGPKVGKVASCAGDQHIWTLTNACEKTAVVRYLSLDALRWGEVSLAAGKSAPLECCAAGNFTCRFEGWTTEFR